MGLVFAGQAAARVNLFVCKPIRLPAVRCSLVVPAAGAS